MITWIINALDPVNMNVIMLLILLAISAFKALESLIRYVAPITSTSIDDKLVALLDKLEAKTKELSENAWVKENAGKFFAMIENLATLNAPELKGVSKLATALTVAHAAWEATSGKTLSNEGVALLKEEMAKRSLQAKLVPVAVPQADNAR